MSFSKHRLTARAEGRNVLVSCVGSISCRVLGTTIPVSVVLEKDGASFTAHLPKSAVGDGLVAVALHNEKAWDGGVLAITANADGHAHTDPDRSWVPGGKVMVHVERNGVFVTDVAYGMRFTTSKFDAKDEWTYVPDGNLLMRYVAGLVPLDEVRKAAQAQVEEKSARERLAEVERELPALRQAAERLEGIEDAVREFASALRDLAASTREAMPHALLEAHRALEQALERPAPMTDARRAREMDQYVRALLKELTQDIRDQLSEEVQGALALLEVLLTQ